MGRHHILLASTALLLAFALASCVVRRSAPETPATFAGTLPCTDCPGVDYRITLQRDGTYWLEQRYHARPQEAEPVTHREVGRFRVAAGRITLVAEDGSATWWARAVDGGLFPLVAKDEQVAKAPPTTFARQAAADARFGPLRLRGILSGSGAARRFTPCATGIALAIAGGPDAATLALEHDRLAAKPGSSLLAALEGSLARGADGRVALTVESFERAVRGARCDGAPPARGAR